MRGTDIRLGISVALWLMATVAGLNEASAQRLSPGEHEIEIDHLGHKRYYFVRVPPQASEAKPLPVVLSFHGGGGNAEGHKRMTRMESIADREGFLLVVPEGTGNPQLGRRLESWNVGVCCGPAKQQGVDDVAFVVTLLEDLALRTPVDQTRVYATGLSNGGMMSYRLALDVPERIAAVAPVAGVILGEPKAPVAIMDFHSVDDPRAHYEGGDTRFPLTNHIVHHVSVPEVLRQWTEGLSCGPESIVDRRNGTPGAPDASHRAEKLVWSGCTGGGEVVHWRMHGPGHVWPGQPAYASEALVGAPSNVLDANEEMWRFFTRYRKPDAPALLGESRQVRSRLVPEAEQKRRHEMRDERMKHFRKGTDGRSMLDHILSEGVELSFNRSQIQVDVSGVSRSEAPDLGGDYRTGQLGINSALSLYSKLRIGRDGADMIRILAHVRASGATVELDALGRVLSMVRAGAGVTAMYMSKGQNLFLGHVGASLAAEREVLGDSTIRPYAAALGTYQSSDHFYLLYGGALTYSYGRRLFLPAAGIAWMPSKEWQITALLPFFIGAKHKLSDKLALRAALTIAGDQYNIDNGGQYPMASDTLRLRAYEARAVFGANYDLNDDFQLVFDVGVAAPRGLAIVDGDSTLADSSIDPAGFAKAAVVWRFGSRPL